MKPILKMKVIYADPPWKFNNKKTGGSMDSGAEAKYATMPVEEICAMDVKSITADDCILFMWWVGAMPEEAVRVAKAWGFKVKTMTGFNWIKLTEKEKLDFGMGFYSRAGSECCLIATKGRPKVVNHSVRSVILAKKRAHSQKPDEARTRIEKMMGDKVEKVELFARKRFKGWSAFGNQVRGSIKIKMNETKKLVGEKELQPSKV